MLGWDTKACAMVHALLDRIRGSIVTYTQAPHYLPRDQNVP